MVRFHSAATPAAGAYSTPRGAPAPAAAPVAGGMPASPTPSALLARGLTRENAPPPSPHSIGPGRKRHLNPPPGTVTLHMDEGASGSNQAGAGGFVPVSEPMSGRRHYNTTMCPLPTSLLPQELPNQPPPSSNKRHFAAALAQRPNPLELPAESGTRKRSPWRLSSAPAFEGDTAPAAGLMSPRATVRVTHEVGSGREGGPDTDSTRPWALPSDEVPHCSSTQVSLAFAMDTADAAPLPPPASARRAASPLHKSEGVTGALRMDKAPRQAASESPGPSLERISRRRQLLGNERSDGGAGLDKGLRRVPSEECVRNALGTQQKGRKSQSPAMRDARGVALPPWEVDQSASRRRNSPRSSVVLSGESPGSPPWATEFDRNAPTTAPIHAIEGIKTPRSARGSTHSAAGSLSVPAPAPYATDHDSNVVQLTDRHRTWRVDGHFGSWSSALRHHSENGRSLEDTSQEFVPKGSASMLRALSAGSRGRALMSSQSGGTAEPRKLSAGRVRPALRDSFSNNDNSKVERSPSSHRRQSSVALRNSESGSAAGSVRLDNAPWKAHGAGPVDEAQLKQLFEKQIHALRNEIDQLQTRHATYEQRLQRFKAETVIPMLASQPTTPVSVVTQPDRSPRGERPMLGAVPVDTKNEPVTPKVSKAGPAAARPRSRGTSRPDAFSLSAAAG